MGKGRWGGVKRCLWGAAIFVPWAAASLAGAQGVLPRSDDGRPAAAGRDAPASPAAVTPSAPESPGSIYNDAMHPLDVVRQSMDNWSSSEMAALGIGMHMAREACERMKPEDYNSDDLYELAHLCAFGQDWSPANEAAQRYLVSKAPEHRAQAFAVSVGAFVHLNAPDLALATTREMLRSEPYDAEVAYTVRYMKDLLETAGSPDALRLAADEHPKVIDALGKGTALKAAYGDAVVNTGVLYATAMEAAFFARYAGDDARAALYAADAEGALPKDAVLTGEDRDEIDSVRLRYRLLGSRLAHIPVIRSFKSATARAQIGADFGAATALVFFPDWCVQCKKMMPTMTEFAAANRDTPIHAYGLLFEEPGEEQSPGTQRELLGTEVMEVSAKTAHSFGMNDYPLGVVVDHEGVIRFIGVLPGDAFNGDGYITKVITRMANGQVKTLAPPRQSNEPMPRERKTGS